MAFDDGTSLGRYGRELWGPDLACLDDLPQANAKIVTSARSADCRLFWTLWAVSCGVYLENDVASERGADLGKKVSHPLLKNLEVNSPCR